MDSSSSGRLGLFVVRRDILTTEIAEQLCSHEVACVTIGYKTVISVNFAMARSADWQMTNTCSTDPKSSWRDYISHLPQDPPRENRKKWPLVKDVPLSLASCQRDSDTDNGLKMEGPHAAD